MRAGTSQFAHAWKKTVSVLDIRLKFSLLGMSGVLMVLRSSCGCEACVDCRRCEREKE